MNVSIRMGLRTNPSPDEVVKWTNLQSVPPLVFPTTEREECHYIINMVWYTYVIKDSTI